MPNTKRKKREVKQWAIILKSDLTIENESKFYESDCMCAPEPEAVAIFRTRKNAEFVLGTYYKPDYEIVPVKITY